MRIIQSLGKCSIFLVGVSTLRTVLFWPNNIAETNTKWRPRWKYKWFSLIRRALTNLLQGQRLTPALKECVYNIRFVLPHSIQNGRESTNFVILKKLNFVHPLHSVWRQPVHFQGKCRFFSLIGSYTRTVPNYLNVMVHCSFQGFLTTD